ncbi:hypothetical protein AUP68_08555 [Ilyonectria robusta]
MLLAADLQLGRMGYERVERHVYMIIGQVHQRLQELGKLRERYALRDDVVTERVQASKPVKIGANNEIPTAKPLFQNRQIAEALSKDARVRQRRTRVVSFFRRVNFTWSFNDDTNDRDSIMAHIQTLKDCNDALRECLPPLQQQAADRIVNLKTLALSSTPSDLRGIGNAASSSAGHPYFSALPHCEGFFEKSRTCFALVYQLPPFAVDNQPPLTLYSILPRNMHSVADEKVSTSKSFLPSLEQRYDLAAAVADGVLSLLSVDWMHKTINSRNVALYNARPATGASSSLAGPGPTHGLDFRAPQLLGFGLSRPERLGERTVDLRDGGRSSWRFWLHPKLRYDGPHRQFERAFDVYALGVVLFEIGMWQDAHYYTSGGPRAAGLSADEFRRRLVHVCARDMAHHMGGAYKAAVMMCLDGDELWGSAKGLANSEKEGEASGDTVDVDGLSMAELFYLHVYSVLRGCCKVA